MSNSDYRITPDLLAKHGDGLRALVRGILLDEDRAEDVLQETWIAAIKTPPRGIAAMGAWLRRVARNIAWRAKREDDRRARREFAAARRGIIPPAVDDRARQQLARTVVDAVLTLKEPYRTAVLMRYFEDLTPTEIAGRLNIPPGTVKTRLKRALNQLRGRLESSFGGKNRSWCAALLPLLQEGESALSGGPASSVLLAALFKAKFAIAGALVVAAAALWFWPGSAISPPAGRQAPVTDESAPVAAAAPTGATHTPRIPPHEPSAAEEPELLAAESRDEKCILGTVSDPGGNPIEGARIRASLAYGNPWERVLARSHKTRTDASGRYRLGPLDCDRYAVEASAPGKYRKRMPAVAGSRLDFRLGPPAGLAGRITTPDGRPAPGVEVVVLDAAFMKACNSHLYFHLYLRTQQKVGPHWRVCTDERGTYRFSDLPPDSYSVRAFPKDRLPAVTPFDVRLRAGRTTERSLTLPEYPRFRLAGRVLDDQTARPIQGATIFLGPENPNQRAVTDVDGRYVLPGLSQNREPTVIAYAEEYAWSSRAVPYLAVVSRAELDFRLRRLGRVRGRVVGPDGKPVAGAEVAPEPVMAFIHTTRGTRTAQDGSFDLRMEPGKPRPLFAIAEGCALGFAPPFDLGPGETRTGIVLRLTRGGAVAGQILDRSGRAAIGAVNLMPRLENHRTIPWFRGRMLAPGGGFRFDHVPAGRYMIQFRSSPANVQNYPQVISVTDGETTLVTLSPYRGHPIAGRVVGPGGTSVPGARIIARSADPKGYGSTVVSQTDGRFRHDPLPRGVYTLRVQACGFFDCTLENVRTGRTELTLSLERAVPLKGRVLRADTGMPEPSFRVRAFLRSSTPRGYYERTFVDLPDGRFVSPVDHPIPPGTYDVEAYTRTGLVSSLATGVVLCSGTEGPALTLHLSPGAVLEGTVRRSDSDTIVSGVKVALRSLATPPTAKRVVKLADTTGRFLFRGLQPGLYRLKAVDPAWPEVSKDVRVLLPQTVTTLSLPHGCSLQLRVEDPSGQPVCEARIAVETDRGEMDRWDTVSLKTDGQGELRLEGLLPGEYRVRATHPDWVEDGANVAVGPGGTYSLTLCLRIGGALRITARTRTGAPVAGARVTISGPGGEIPFPAEKYFALFEKRQEEDPELWWDEYLESRSRTDAAGTLLRRFLPPGSYTVDINTRAHGRARQLVHVMDGRVTPVVIELGPSR